MFILLEEAGLKPNLGSYCAALECMGRNPSCSPKVITRYVHTHTTPINKDYYKHLISIIWYLTRGGIETFKEF